MYLLSFEFFIILEIVTRVGDLDLKIPAHFLTEDDLLETVDPLKIANICLKLNANLGGINYRYNRYILYIDITRIV
jgi:hypothetical protein